MQTSRNTRRLSRRGLLQSGMRAAVAAGVVGAARVRGMRAQERADATHGRVTVTAVEVHDITVDYEDFLAYELNHYYGPSRRTVYVARASNGEIGLGEGVREADNVVAQYVGTSPFDWIGDETSLPIGMAMYDLMGKLAGVPVYKLFGQRYRSWVPAAAWTVSTHPRRMANAVKKYAARGYTWMKYHLSPFENVLDQMQAMQEVAPAGFRIHHDLTMGGTDDHMFELLEQISRFSIAGCFEDPLPEKDIAGYAELRAKCRLPILYHHTPLGAGLETLSRPADGYIIGHARIGDAVRRAGLFAALELPFSLQNVGGTITRAMTVHMQAAFKTAWQHFNSVTETLKSDVVQERLEPIQGRVRVPESPGLGVTLDRAELDRLKGLTLPDQPPWIIKSAFADGTRMYNRADTKDPLFLVRPDKRREVTLSYMSPLTTEYWDDDGSDEYRRLLQRTEREGTVFVRPNESGSPP